MLLYIVIVKVRPARRVGRSRRGRGRWAPEDFISAMKACRVASAAGSRPLTTAIACSIAMNRPGSRRKTGFCRTSVASGDFTPASTSCCPAQEGGRGVVAGRQPHDRRVLQRAGEKQVVGAAGRHRHVGAGRVDGVDRLHRRGSAHGVAALDQHVGRGEIQAPAAYRVDGEEGDVVGAPAPTAPVTPPALSNGTVASGTPRRRASSVASMAETRARSCRRGRAGPAPGCRN